MVDLIRQLINGMQIGSVYALVALGYTMVYGIIMLINFAHGDVIMVGAYVSLISIPFFISAGLPVWLCIIVSVIACSALGILMEKIAYKPLRNAPRLCSLITAIGMSLFLQNLFVLIFTPNVRPFPTVFDLEPIVIQGVQISSITVLTIAVSVVLMIALSIFIKGTKVGTAMRAVSEDAGAAKLMGINVNVTISITFAIGSALAAVGAVFYSSAYPMVEPYMGSMLGLKAFIAAVLGGIGSIPGAMLGGVIMGVVESLTKAYISSQLADAVVFGILIIVLLVKPSGLFGKNIKEKV
ncbi:MAG: branched-chain amino acid ABC transporter permease [Christensenellales bacterium]|jgi:branched-chain amino acid transport system permease protein